MEDQDTELSLRNMQKSDVDHQVSRQLAHVGDCPL